MATKINSKAKGSKGERDLCKWWKNWTGQEFSRVPSSGGLRWSRTTDTTGDIINSDKKYYLRFPFSIECKNYKNIDFKDILKENKNCQVLKFWQQATGDAERGNKLPILFMRENGMPKNVYYVVMNANLAKLIKGETFKHPYFHVKWLEYNFYIITSKELVDIDYQAMYKNFRKLLKSTKNEKVI